MTGAVRAKRQNAKRGGDGEVDRSPAASASPPHRLQVALNKAMRSPQFRTGSVDESLKYLCKMTALELGVDRAGIILLDGSGAERHKSVVYVVADARVERHLSFSRTMGLGLFKNTSAAEVVAVDDLSKPNVLSQFRGLVFKKLNAKSTLHAPIVCNGNVAGFITATTVYEKKCWQTQESLFASAIASLVAEAMERRVRERAEKEARGMARRMHRQQALIDSMMQTVSQSSGNLTQLYDMVSEALLQQLRVDRVTIRLSMDANSTPVFRRDAGCPGVLQPADGIRLRDIGWSPRLLAVLRKGPVCIDDCKSHPLTRALYERRWRSRKISSFIVAPVICKDSIQGSVFCSKIGRKTKWSPADRLLISSVANILSLAHEQDLRESSEQKLRHALLAKSRFMANMSHEIRTPMNGVLGVTDLLGKTRLNDRQSELVDIIRQSSEALLTIINDILDVSRIENGAMTVERQSFDLAAGVEQVASLLADQAYRKKLAFDLHIDDSAPVAIELDPGRFRQVLINLIGNAIKFTERGGVSIRVESDGRDRKPHGVKVTIRDTGVGIPAEVHEKLFKPFSQADTSISRRFGGTGLGLSIARDLTQMMQGELALDSASGVGTTVSLTFPLIEGQAVETLGATAPRRPNVYMIVAGDPASGARAALRHYVEGMGGSCRFFDEFAFATEALLKAAADGSRQVIGLFEWAMIAGEPVRIQQLQRLKHSAPHVRLVILGGRHSLDELASDQRELFGGFLTEPLLRSAVVGLLTSETAGGVSAAECPADPDERRAEIRCSILFAEDNRINRLVAKEYLTRRGCDLTFANDGRAAVAAFAGHSFDLVLMDCQMPEQDGISATREIRDFERRNRRAPTPIIAVTANAYDQDRVDCLRSGMDDYISKPYSEQQLVDTVLRWLRPAVRSAAVGATPIR